MQHASNVASQREPIGELIVTPRPLSEYRDMFLLSDEDLVSGPILDCPGGASPFGAQLRARGGTAVSVDPAYVLPPQELAERITADIEHASRWMRSHPGNFDWSYMGSPASFTRSFQLAAELFLTDFQPDGERYVAASLPTLPFADGSFRLTLCSHLLFCYGEYLGYDEHLASVLELVRVTSGEVRIYPLIDTAGLPYPRLDELRAELAGHGITTSVRRTRSQYVLGTDRMLVCRRDDGWSRPRLAGQHEAPVENSLLASRRGA